MTLQADTAPVGAQHDIAATLSPVASERVRALALRAIEGAPALSAGEMRELADAILEHNALSAQQA